MSLMKSFNFNFLKQNIKKSKGGIIISLIIVPLIISIGMVVSGINSDSSEFITPESFGMIDLVFMYIIPFVYSVFLFGFVFKKPSTDFMNSMPINRKTMFVTNTIGGIALITIIQLLSAFTVLLWGGLFGNLVVFPMSVLEMTLLSWCSYVFVFVSANLALTFSGTLMTQLVVTVLILFLVPVCTESMQIINSRDDYYYYNYEDELNYDLSIADGYQVTHYNLLDKTKNYTMPFKLIRYGLEFSWQTIIRMLILSLIYYFIGLKLYQKRKMEDNEESFGNTKLHIIVKGLTLIPILLFANFVNISEDATVFVVAVILSAVYYLIFDLIVKRKIPIKTTILSFIISIFVIQASIITAKSVIKDEKIDLDYEDIKEVSVGFNNNANEMFYSYSRYNNLLLDGNYFVKDKDVLDLILKAKEKVENKNSSSYEDGYYNVKDLYFNIKLNSGKEYYMKINIRSSDYNEIFSCLKKNDKYFKHIKNDILEQDGIYLLDDDIIDSKTKKLIKKEIKDNLDKIKISDFNFNSNINIDKNVYKNHKLISYKIPANLTNNLTKIVAEFANNSAVKNIKGYKNSINVSVYKKDEFYNSLYGNEDILEFIEEHYLDEFNPSKKYYVLDGNLETREGYKSFVFYTNDTEEIDEILKVSGSYNYNNYR